MSSPLSESKPGTTGDFRESTRPAPAAGARDVDPALAALWDSGVVAPLEAAGEALRAAGEREPVALVFTALERAETSIRAAADACANDVLLESDLRAIEETVMGIAADALKPLSSSELESLRRRVDEAARRAERVFG